MAFRIFLSVKAGLDVICSQSCSLGDATTGLPFVTEQKAEFFCTLYCFVVKTDICAANSTSEVFFLNEIVGVTSSTTLVR